MTNGLNLEASTARSEALASLEKTFKIVGIENPAREARVSLCAASGISPVALIVEPREPLGSAAWKVQEVAERRATGEPLSRIVGKREFWGLSFAITPHVLDPRPETETIIEAALSLLSDRREDQLRILDLGVGSGALLCALLTEFGAACGIGVDISADAAKVAQGNLQACGLSLRAEIRVGDWTSGLEGRFDLIVSNPPYIPTADLAGLPREVRDFDPWLALDGGIDGLAALSKNPNGIEAHTRPARLVARRTRRGSSDRRHCHREPMWRFRRQDLQGSCRRRPRRGHPALSLADGRRRPKMEDAAEGGGRVFFSPRANDPGTTRRRRDRVRPYGGASCPWRTGTALASACGQACQTCASATHRGCRTGAWRRRRSS